MRVTPVARKHGTRNWQARVLDQLKLSALTVLRVARVHKGSRSGNHLRTCLNHSLEAQCVCGIYSDTTNHIGRLSRMEVPSVPPAASATLGFSSSV